MDSCCVRPFQSILFLDTGVKVIVIIGKLILSTAIIIQNEDDKEETDTERTIKKNEIKI